MTATLLTQTRHTDLLFPTPRIRGRAVTRLEERTLAWVSLGAEAANELGREHLGWFVGGHPGLRRAAEQLGRLDSNPGGGIWVAVPVGRDASRELFEHWPHGSQIELPPSWGGSIWRSRKVWVAMPEDLRQLLPAIRTSDCGVAGIMLIDPLCIIHKARAGTNWKGEYHRNDRPQHVVNFRAALQLDDWQPPLIVLTQQQAKAVDTDVIARTYCLDGFRFIAGDSFGCWDQPVEE